VDLIETLALRIVDVCLLSQSVRWVSVTVHKPAAPIAVPFDDVTVTIERSRQ
jgi:dihydroneopterin aldolase